MANKYHSGVDGRVRVGAGETIVAGLTKWALNITAPVVEATNFESTADSNQNVWRELVSASNSAGPKVGVVVANVTMSGRFNSDATQGSLATLNIGSIVSLDLLLSKSEPFGFSDLVAVITEIGITSDMKSTEAAEFTAKAELSGVLPGGSTTLT